MKSRFWARVASASIVLFLILLAALHFLEPEYDPSRHLISEYELGRYGWMMSLAFFSLGASVFAMLFSTWYPSTTRRGLLGRWWFLAISVAFVGAGVFRPHITPNLASYLHGICGIIIIVTFPIAASLYNSGLAHSEEWAGSRRLLSWMTWLVWVGLLSFVGSTVVLGILAGSVNRSEATLLIGWQNRFMILTYSLWLIIAAWPVVISKNRDL
jgi:NAD/NADP transhydrogenase beta subunit